MSAIVLVSALLHADGEYLLLSIYSQVTFEIYMIYSSDL